MIDRCVSYALPSKEDVDFIHLQHVYYNPSLSTFFVSSAEEEDKMNCRNGFLRSFVAILHHGHVKRENPSTFTDLAFHAIEWEDPHTWLLPLPACNHLSDFTTFSTMIFSLLNVQLYPAFYPPIHTLLLPSLTTENREQSFAEIVTAVANMRNHGERAIQVMYGEEIARQAGNGVIHFSSLVGE